MPVSPDQFVQAVRPLLSTCDVHQFCAKLKHQFSEGDLLDYLHSTDCDARKVAALALGLLGRPSCLKSVARLLADPDPVVNQMAEHALWSIWFRSGDPAANGQMKKGVKCLCARQFNEAIEQFTAAINADPDFAEAFNQRAIAYYLSERYDESAADCEKTVELMPCHFGAWAGLGHCHAHQHRTSDAIEAYERALKINPHLASVRETLEQLRGQV